VITLHKPKTSIKFSTDDLMLLQAVLRSYPAPHNIQLEILDLYEKITKHLER
jgi:hypothetical protein